MIPVFFAAARYAIRTRRGRLLLLLGATHAVRLARSPQARHAYGRAWEVAADPRHRRAARNAVRSAARRVKR